MAITQFVIFIFQQTCPACHKHILQIEGRNQNIPASVMIPRHTVFPTTPQAVNRQISSDVPEPFRQDFSEAVQTLSISPKASAALSRRIIQALLREKAGTTKRDLRDQIDEVVNAKVLPSYISDDLHAARNVGNFAAHETKDKLSGEVLDVEPGEAEWILNVAEAMLDFYFVEPAKAVKRRAQLNEKLDAAGKPKIEEPPAETARVQ